MIRLNIFLSRLFLPGEEFKHPMNHGISTTLKVVPEAHVVRGLKSQKTRNGQFKVIKELHG